MDTSGGADLAMLLFGGFAAMVDEVVVELDQRGHPGVTASHEFALQAIDAGASNASDLGRALGVSRQAAAKSIAALEQLGYVERQSDPSDGRQKQLLVTDRGYDMVRIGAATFDKIRARWAKQLGRAQLDVLESSLRALVTARTRAHPVERLDDQLRRRSPRLPDDVHDPAGRGSGDRAIASTPV